MGQGVRPADAVVAAFIADSDRIFTATFDKMPISEQRRIYDAYWQRYHAARPEGITVETITITALSGKCRAVLYRPAQHIVGESLPIVVYFHGGGWIFGSPESHDLPVSRLCTEAEVAVLSLDYRLSPEHIFPDALMDCLVAVTWVARKGYSYGLDSKRLVVAGDSAGANLAAGLCLWLRDHGGPRIVLQALIYPILTREIAASDYGSASAASISRYVMAYFGKQDLSANSYAMPLSAKSFAGLPPAFIATAQMDLLLPHGKMFAKHLRYAGIPCEYTCGYGLPHTYLRLLHLSATAMQEFTACCTAIRSAVSLPQGKAS